MESNSYYKIPLSELIAILKVNGFEVSIERILEMQSALLSTSVSKLSLSELKFIVTPILAKNAEDQKNIYKIIDSYISDKAYYTENKTAPFNAWMKNKRLVFGLKVTGLVIVVATAVLVYLLQKKEIKKTTTTTTPLPIQVLNKLEPIVDSSAEKEARQRPKNISPVTGNIQYSGKAIIPERINIILQVAGAFGIGLGGILYYFIFFERRKRMEAKKKVKEDDEGFGAGQGGPDKIRSEQSVYTTLQFPKKNYLVQKTKEFSVIRSNLKRPGFAEKPSLNIKKSVYATTMNAGFPILALDDQWKERKYLFLHDQMEEDAHINQLFQFFENFLTSADISITRYSFKEDIRILTGRDHEAVSLDDLSYEYPGYHLLIISDCHSFFDNSSLLQPDLPALFQKWSSRSIITPLSLYDWSSKEIELQNNSFNVVPAEIEAIEVLSKAITEESTIKPGLLMHRIKDKYAVAKHDFKTAIGLKSYLNNEELFKVVCSLAVYPKLEWNVTLALFAAIIKKDPKVSAAITMDYDALLKISRIPWMHHTEWDQDVRLQLFDSLQPETEVIARETIIELLKETNPFVLPGSPAAKELQVQMKVNSFFLYAHDQQQYKEYAGVKNDFLEHWNNLNEWALTERKKNGLMPVNNTGEQSTVEEFILKEEQFEKRNVTFLRVALLSLPAAVLYILLSVFRPPVVYLNSYEKISFVAIVTKDSTCEKELSQVVVTTLDRFDTITMKKDSSVNYIQVENTEYGRPVEFSFLFADSTFADVSVEAKDSIAMVSLKCH